MLETVKAFVNNFEFGPKNIQVAVFAFTDDISRRIIKLNDFSDRNLFLDELLKYEKDHCGGGTRTDRALRHLRDNVFTEKNGDRDMASNIALIFTDGQSNRPTFTEEEVLKTKDSNINIISIGIGNRINKKELELIATRKEDVILTDFTQLIGIVGNLVNKTCNGK